MLIWAFNIFLSLALMLFFRSYFQLLPYMTCEAKNLLVSIHLTTICTCFCDAFAQAAPVLWQIFVRSVKWLNQLKCKCESREVVLLKLLSFCKLLTSQNHQSHYVSQNKSWKNKAQLTSSHIFLTNRTSLHQLTRRQTLRYQFCKTVCPGNYTKNKWTQPIDKIVCSFRKYISWSFKLHCQWLTQINEGLPAAFAQDQVW